MEKTDSKGTWTLREAKAHLTQILSLAEVDGPQYISASQVESPHIKEPGEFVIVPAKLWHEKNPPEIPMGQWLLENTPRGIGTKEPEYDENGRFIPFSDVIFDEEE